jgi:DNA-binding response OmpR family regulator
MAQNQHVMLVEDDVSLRDVYQTRLTAEGFTVTVAPDGETALAQAIEEQPDLILLDIMMPKIDGFSVLDILKRTPATKDCKVIVLSALSEDTDRARANELGADDYIVKSEATLNDVVDRARRHLAHR